MKKILLVTGRYFPKVGGASTYFKEYVVDNLQKECESTILTTNNRNNSKKLIYSIPTFSSQNPIIYKFIFIWLTISSFFLSLYIFSKHSIELVHSHSATGLCLGTSLAAKLKGIPIIKDLRDVKTTFINLTFPRPDRLICLKGPCYKYAISKGVEGKTIISTYLPFSKLKITSTKIPLTSNFQSKEYFLYLGEIKKSKGVDKVMQFAKLFPQYNVVLAGEIKERRWQEKMKKLKNVFYLGSVEHQNIFSLIKNCDFLILPSQSEGIPRSVVEAISMQKPVILTKQKELVTLFSNIKGIYFSDFTKSSMERIIYKSRNVKIPKNEFKKITISKQKYRTLLKRAYKECIN